MDGHTRYNWTFIIEEDNPKIAFICLGSVRTFQWVVMPFGFKNTRVKYQRAKNVIFHDMIGNLMKVYINYVLVKSNQKQEYIADLQKVFK